MCLVYLRPRLYSCGHTTVKTSGIDLCDKQHKLNPKGVCADPTFEYERTRPWSLPCKACVERDGGVGREQGGLEFEGAKVMQVGERRESE